MSLKENLKKELSEVTGAGTLFVKEIHEKAKKIIFFFSEIEKLFNCYTSCRGFPKSMYNLMENENIKDDAYEILNPSNSQFSGSIPNSVSLNFVLIFCFMFCNFDY